jgi:hypothetical protein
VFKSIVICSSAAVYIIRCTRHDQGRSQTVTGVTVVTGPGPQGAPWGPVKRPKGALKGPQRAIEGPQRSPVKGARKGSRRAEKVAVGVLEEKINR